MMSKCIQWKISNECNIIIEVEVKHQGCRYDPHGVESAPLLLLRTIFF